MDTSICLTMKQAPQSAAEAAIMCDKPYCEAVGTLNWAALATCPNIMFTVAYFTSNPEIVHWEAIKRIFHYLAGMCNLWLLYGEIRCHWPLGWLCAMDQNKLGNWAFLVSILCSQRSTGHAATIGTLVVSLF